MYGRYVRMYAVATVAVVAAVAAVAAMAAAADAEKDFLINVEVYSPKYKIFAETPINFRIVAPTIKLCGL